MVKQTLLILCLVVLVSGLHLHQGSGGSAPLPIYPGKAIIKSSDGSYLSRCNKCDNEGNFDGSVVLLKTLGAEGYWIVDFDGELMTLKADNGKYLSKCTNCLSGGKYPDSAVVNADTVTDSAKWAPQFRNDKFRFRLIDTWMYLSTCSNCYPRSSNTFLSFIEIPDIRSAQIYFSIEYVFPTSGQINIQSIERRYLARCNGCGASKYPDSASVHVRNPNLPWAIWTVQAVGDKVAFKADNGKYLGRCFNCWYASLFPDAVFVHISSTSDPAALWTPVYLDDGNWALKNDLGKQLQVCYHSVYDTNINYFAFAIQTSPMHDSDHYSANWIIKIR